MCGRYTMLEEQMKVKQRFGLTGDILGFEKSYNIAPGQQVLAVIHDGKKRRAGYLKWGLVPAWAKDEKIGNKMINARRETDHVKPSIKKLMARIRCLIIADSLDEWHKSEVGTVKKRIQLESKEPFAFAGLWDKWHRDGKTLFTCTLLTRDSNEFMKNIHHRMPIILPKDKEDLWMKQSFLHARDAHEFLASVQAQS